jgi:hypothetical protein
MAILSKTALKKELIETQLSLCLSIMLLVELELKPRQKVETRIRTEQRNTNSEC